MRRKEEGIPTDGEYVLFSGYPVPIKLQEDTDEELERARDQAEKALNSKLPLSWKTGFPEFTIYRDGEETGAG